jgi:hypothetical protein
MSTSGKRPVSSPWLDAAAVASLVFVLAFPLVFLMPYNRRSPAVQARRCRVENCWIHSYSCREHVASSGREQRRIVDNSRENLRHAAR